MLCIYGLRFVQGHSLKKAHFVFSWCFVVVVWLGSAQLDKCGWFICSCEMLRHFLVFSTLIRTSMWLVLKAQTLLWAPWYETHLWAPINNNLVFSQLYVFTRSNILLKRTAWESKSTRRTAIAGACLISVLRAVRVKCADRNAIHITVQLPHSKCAFNKRALWESLD